MKLNSRNYIKEDNDVDFVINAVLYMRQFPPEFQCNSLYLNHLLYISGMKSFAQFYFSQLLSTHIYVIMHTHKHFHRNMPTYLYIYSKYKYT